MLTNDLRTYLSGVENPGGNGCLHGKLAGQVGGKHFSEREKESFAYAIPAKKYP